MQYCEFFDRRKNTFNKSFELINKYINCDKKYVIVELGTSRSFVTLGIAGCMNPNPVYWQPNNPKMIKTNIAKNLFFIGSNPLNDIIKNVFLINFIIQVMLHK
jgi:hypothetical protein